MTAEVVALLRVLVDQVQAITAILRQVHGLALDDATMARSGGQLRPAHLLPDAREARAYVVGEIVALRPGRGLDVFNFGSGPVRIRIYGLALPRPGQAWDAVPTLPPLTIPAGQGLALPNVWTAGFRVEDAGTLQVVGS